MGMEDEDEEKEDTSLGLLFYPVLPSRPLKFYS